MNRILFFTFFGYRDYILDIKNELSKQNHEIFDIPYFQLKNDDGLSDDDIIQKIVDTVKTENIQFMLMFLLPNCDKFIVDIKSKLVSENLLYSKIIFYNFDDPTSINIDLIRYSVGLDIIFTPNIHSVSKLSKILHDDTKTIHLPLYLKSPHLSIETYNTFKNNHLSTLNDKTYDICILYDEESNKIYDMKQIIMNLKLLCIDKDYTVKLLGPLYLETIYTDIYEGEYSINDISSKTVDSKIVVYIKGSVLDFNSKNDALYELMLSESIVIVPFNKNCQNILKHEHNCIIFDKTHYIQNINFCLKNQEKYDIVRHNARLSITDNLSIEKWCKKLINHTIV